MALAGKKKKIFDGRYEILSIVGRGAASVVYHARHVDTPSSEVALKVLIQSKEESKTSEKLRKEALAMVSSRHKYVIRLDDFHSVGDLCYLSMEYAAESDLRKYSQKFGGKLSPVQGELFLLQLAEALAFMHNAGIVHRDIKPDNILVASPKEIRLADFGVTVLPGEESSLADLQAGVGTMDYMAPEVLEGKRYDAASDIYSLGVAFYELLSGQHPFANIPLAQQLEVRREGKFTPLYKAAPNVPIYLSNLIMQAMQYDTARRIKNAKEIAQAILVSKASVTVPNTAVAPKPSNPALTNPSAGATAASSADARRAAARAILSGTPNKAATPINSALKQSAPAPTPATMNAAAPAAPQAQKSNAAAIMASWAAMGLSKPNVTAAPKQEAAEVSASDNAKNIESKAEPAPPTTAPEAARAKTDTIAAAPKEAPIQNKAPEKAIPGIISVAAAPPAPSVAAVPVQSAAPQSAANSSPAVTDTVILKPSDIAAAKNPAPKGGSLAAGALLQGLGTTDDSHEETAPKTETKTAPEETADLPESKKTTQIITKDLVQRVRADFAAEEAQTPTSLSAQPEAPSVTPAATKAATKPEGRKPLQRKGEKNPQKNQRKQGKQEPQTLPPLSIRARQLGAALMLAFRQRDRKKSFFMAMSMFVFLVILYYGNIFLIRHYNIGIAKSYLAEEPPKPSPLPQYSGGEIGFPALPAGVFSGSISGVIPGETNALTFISLGEQKKLVVLLGIPGWKPAVVNIDASSTDASPSAPVRLSSSGFVLDISGKPVNGELVGEFTDVISGAKGEWRIKPVQR